MSTDKRGLVAINFRIVGHSEVWKSGSNATHCGLKVPQWGMTRLNRGVPAIFVGAFQVITDRGPFVIS